MKREPHVLVLDRDAALYVDAIEAVNSDLQVIGVEDESKAIEISQTCEVLVALAHVVSARLVAAMPQLKFVQALTTGTDHLTKLDLPADVVIASMRGIHGPQIAEVAFLYMIALSRQFIAMQANQRARRWERWPQRLLMDKTLVIVGIGAISEALALRARAFAMHVLGVSDYRTQAIGFDEVHPRWDLNAVAARADFLVVLAPLTDATRRMIDSETLKAMKPGSILINLARGPVVDEAALIEALQSGHLGGAGLDVFEVEPLPSDSPLWDMPHVILTPRIGGMSDVYVKQALPVVLHNLAAWRRGDTHALRNRLALRLGDRLWRSASALNIARLWVNWNAGGGSCGRQ